MTNTIMLRMSDAVETIESLIYDDEKFDVEFVQLDSAGHKVADVVLGDDTCQFFYPLGSMETTRRPVVQSPRSWIYQNLRLAKPDQVITIMKSQNISR